MLWSFKLFRRQNTFFGFRSLIRVLSVIKRACSLFLNSLMLSIGVSAPDTTSIGLFRIKPQSISNDDITRSSVTAELYANSVAVQQYIRAVLCATYAAEK